MCKLKAKDYLDNFSDSANEMGVGSDKRMPPKLEMIKSGMHYTGVNKQYLSLNLGKDPGMNAEELELRPTKGFKVPTIDGLSSPFLVSKKEKPTYQEQSFLVSPFLVTDSFRENITSTKTSDGVFIPADFQPLGEITGEIFFKNLLKMTEKKEKEIKDVPKSTVTKLSKTSLPFNTNSYSYQTKFKVHNSR